MRSEFEPEKPRIESQEELHLLIQRLHRFEDSEPEPTFRKAEITVEDVAEALGLHPSDVERELVRLHDEHRAARVSGVLRELEEPLYRVERPSSERTPLADPLFRMRSVRMLMDLRKDTPHLPRRLDTKDEEARAVSNRIGLVIGVVLIILVFALIIKTAI